MTRYRLDFQHLPLRKTLGRLTVETPETKIQAIRLQHLFEITGKIPSPDALKGAFKNLWKSC